MRIGTRVKAGEEPLLDIILLSHNHVDLTIRAVTALYNYTDKPFLLTVVDDSTDETEAYLKRFCKDHNNAQYIRPTVEVKCVHHAINMALKITKSPYFCFLCNSVFVEPNWLDAAYKLISQRDDCGVVGFKILNTWGTLQATSIMGVFENGLMAVNGKEEPGHRCTFISQVPAIGGCIFLAKRAAIETLDGGKLDEDSYIPFRGWDDLDMCLSLKQKGWDVIYCGYGAAYHIDSPTKRQGIPEAQFLEELELNRKKFMSKWDFNV